MVETREELQVKKQKKEVNRPEAEKTEKQNVRTEKPVTIAVNEIAQGKVGYVRSEALAKAQEYEAEKIAAIQSLNDGEYNEGGVVVGEDIVEPVFIDEEE